MDKVLVAVDGSPASVAALDWAVDHARISGAQLRLVTVVWSGHASFTFDSEIEPLYGRVLSEAAERARSAFPEVDLEVSMLHGVPAAELVTESEEADLLVLGTDKSSRIAGMVYGTLPLRVAARAHCPVVAVPRTWAAPKDGPIVLGVGDDDPSPETAEFAAQQALARKAPLHLVHVWASSPIHPAPVRQQVGHLHESIRRWHQEVVTETANRLRAAHPELDLVERLIEGPRIPQLIEAGEAGRLLVVGRRGGILRGLVLGSAAHDVLMNPPCPVAIVPVEDGRAEEGSAEEGRAEERRAEEQDTAESVANAEQIR